MRFTPLFFIAIFFFSCKQRPAENKESAITDTTAFFEVSQYLQSQVDDVLATPYYIYKKYIEGNRIDSFSITSQQFATIARKFVVPDISKPELKKEYEEAAFLDQSTKTYTLSYSTKNKDLEVQSIDVLLKEDASTIKRIFIRKFFSYQNDSSAIEQLNWMPNEQFQISRLVQIPGKPERESRTIVAWNVSK